MEFYLKYGEEDYILTKNKEEAIEVEINKDDFMKYYFPKSKIFKTEFNKDTYTVFDLEAVDIKTKT